MLPAFFLLLLAAVSNAGGAAAAAGNVMMEYIGASGGAVSFDDVPVDPHIDFHFILSFAIDANTAGKPQGGKFTPYWYSGLDAAAVRAVKQRHPNAKVLVSLSGWSIGDIVLRWTDPADPNLWVSNAFASIGSIVREYGLDGVDIDYEKFAKGETTFAFCIGELITMLKNQSVISLATIAPYYNTSSYYTELYGKYGEKIDYVNYQFYTDKVRTPAAYLADYKFRVGEYGAAKLLASYEVNGRGIQGDAFFAALAMIRGSSVPVNGVMIWSADQSQANGFYFETKSQAFLLNSTAAATDIVRTGRRA